jgi:hypothetical protein
MNWKKLVISLAFVFAIVLSSSRVVRAVDALAVEPTAELLASGLAGGSGSTVGPDGALYVTEGGAGRVSRIDPQTGAVTTFASGLPLWIFGIGGAIDIAFIDGTAYVLVTMVGSDIGGSDVVGIYRVDGPNSFTVIADIGTFSINNPPPPQTSFFIPTGVQYALQPYKGGFLVTDGHLNRVLSVGLDGSISELIGFGNTVPTGLAVWGNDIYMAEAGPIPHLPQDGKVITFGPKDFTASEVASGARLLVDVEFGPGHTMYGLAQGYFPPGNPEGSPAAPNTGALMKVNEAGGFDQVFYGLNQPTSLEFIGNTAYVVTLGGEVWKLGKVKD